MATMKPVPSTKVVCVGRNYADHAKELGNDVPTSPIIFIKPISSMVAHTEGIDVARATQDGQRGALHFECELCVRMGKPLSQALPAQVMDSIDAVTLGLDLTLRDLQNTLKQKGHPWERAKAFDGACVLGEWLSVDAVEDFTNLSYQLLVNGAERQRGDTCLMLFPIVELLADISQQFSLAAGDVVMTGTPKGVGEVHAGDELAMVLQDARWVVEAR